jgi:glycosyltransferase involved in cell wall biosynthesis
LLKVDLVMWAWNGEKTIGAVLNQINKVVPKDVVGQKIVVDDASTDNTAAVARRLGWRVVPNRGKGISDGANTALSFVETEFFCSFEQDLLLSPKWWNSVKKLIVKKGVGAASGIRHQYPSRAVGLLHEYTAERYVMHTKSLPFYLATDARQKSAMSWGHTLDNTIYRTEIIRLIGGFPKLPVSGGVDTVLTWRLITAGYSWETDFSVVSLHLNKTFRNELKSQFFYGSCWDAINYEVPALPVNLYIALIRFLFSPLSALHPALVKRCPSIMVVYPFMRLQLARGIIYNRKKGIYRQ